MAGKRGRPPKAKATGNIVGKTDKQATYQVRPQHNYLCPVCNHTMAIKTYPVKSETIYCINAGCILLDRLFLLPMLDLIPLADGL